MEKIYKIIVLFIIICISQCNQFPEGGIFGFYYLHKQNVSIVIVSPVDSLFTAENSAQISVNIKLNEKPSSDVILPLISSTDIGEGTVSPTTLTFTPENYNVEQSIVITGINDDLQDGPQTYEITFDNLTSRDPYYNNQSISSLSVKNADDDLAGITVSPTTGLITTEGGGTDQFTVVLDSEPVADVVVSLSSVDSSEGLPAPSSLTFTSANWNTPQTVTVTGEDDQIEDGNKIYSIVTATASTDPVYVSIDPDDASLTNTDVGDVAGIIVTSEACGLFTTEAGSSDTFTVKLNTEPIGTVNIPLESSILTEGAVSPASLTFTPADWNVDQTVTVTGVDDGTTTDSDDAYSISIGPATTIPASLSDYDGETTAVSALNLHNHNYGVAAITSVCRDLTTSEGGDTGYFSIILRTAPTVTVTEITAASSNTNEGTTASVLTFSNTNWYTRQTVSIAGANDDIDDGDVDYNIMFSGASGDVNYNNATLNGSASLTNTDDDTAGVTVTPTTTPASRLFTSEDGSLNPTFTVVLDSKPVADVTIPISSDDTDEGNVDETSLTFTSANWNTPQTVTVTGVIDNINDNNQDYTIIVGNASSADGKYQNKFQTDVFVTNIDVD